MKFTTPTKKLFSILLAALLLLPSCTKPNEDETSAPVHTETEQSETDASESDAPETDAPETDAPETDAPETNAPETNAPAEAPVSPIGSVENGVYTNELLGWSLDLDGWDYSTEEDAQVITDHVYDALSEQENIYGAYLKANPGAYIADLYAVRDGGLVTINVQITEQDSALASYSDEEIMDITIRTLKDAMTEMFTSMGIETESIELVKVNFLGKETPALKLTATASGLPYYALQIMRFNLNGFSIDTTFSSLIEDVTEEMLALCYPAGGTPSTAPVPSVSLDDFMKETEAVSDETEASATDVPADAAVVPVGTLENGTYTNPYLGLRVALGDNWVCTTADGFEENLPYLNAGVLANVPENTNISVFSADNSETLDNFNIIYQKPDAITKLSYALLSEGGMIDAMLTQKDALIASYEASGFTVNSIEKVTVNFLGREMAALKTDCSVSGMGYYVLQLIDKTDSDYVAYYTFAAFLEDTTADLLAMMEAAE